MYYVEVAAKLTAHNAACEKKRFKKGWARDPSLQSTEVNTGTYFESWRIFKLSFN